MTMALVAYAGKDEPEPTNRKQVNAYDKFMAGADTLALATRYGINESTALRWISRERSRRHELPSPYEARS